MADSISHFILANRFIEEHKNIFNKDFIDSFYLGALGPDFFYFKLDKNGMKLGGDIHNNNISNLFEYDTKNLSQKNDYYKGYYFGMLLHYFSDKNIHEYVGYHTKIDKTPYLHSIIESSIDIDYVKKKLDIDIKDFDFDNFYKLSSDLIREVTKFYKERYDSKVLKYGMVKSYYRKFFHYTKVFINPSKIFVFLLRIFEKITYSKNKYLCHLKIERNHNSFYMNDNNREWVGTNNRKLNYSVSELFDISYDEFIKEYNLIISSPDSYKFLHKEKFSNNCI